MFGGNKRNNTGGLFGGGGGLFSQPGGGGGMSSQGGLFSSPLGGQQQQQQPGGGGLFSPSGNQQQGGGGGGLGGSANTPGSQLLGGGGGGGGLFQSQPQQQNTNSFLGTGFGQSNVAVKRDMKISDLPHSCGARIRELQEAIRAFDQNKQTVNETMEGFEAQSRHCGDLLRHCECAKQTAENGLSTAQKDFKGVKGMVRADQGYVENTRRRIHAAYEGLPQPLTLPSEYIQNFVDRAESRIESLERQLEELEHVFLNDLIDPENNVDYQESSSLGSGVNVPSNVLSNAMLNTSGSIPYNSYYGGSFASTLSHSSMVLNGSSTAPHNSYHRGSSRAMIQSSRELQDLSPEQKRKRPLLVARQRNIRSTNFGTEVVEKVIRAQHAAVLRLAGDVVATAHERVGQMRTQLNKLLKKVPDGPGRDPFAEADEKEQDEQRRARPTGKELSMIATGNSNNNSQLLRS